MSPCTFIAPECSVPRNGPQDRARPGPGLGGPLPARPSARVCVAARGPGNGQRRAGPGAVYDAGGSRIAAVDRDERPGDRLRVLHPVAPLGGSGNVVDDICLHRPRQVVVGGPIPDGEHRAPPVATVAVRRVQQARVADHHVAGAHRHVDLALGVLERGVIEHDIANHVVVPGRPRVLIVQRVALAVRAGKPAAGSRCRGWCRPGSTSGSTAAADRYS